MEQFVLVPVSAYNSKTRPSTIVTNTETYVSGWKTPEYQVDSLRKDINKKSFGEAALMVDKLLSSPRIKLSIFNFILLDGKDTGVSLIDFAQKLRRKNTEVPDIHLTLLDGTDFTPSLVFNQRAKEKDRGD